MTDHATPAKKVAAQFNLAGLLLAALNDRPVDLRRFTATKKPPRFPEAVKMATSKSADGLADACRAARPLLKLLLLFLDLLLFLVLSLFAHLADGCAELPAHALDAQLALVR